VSVAVVDTRSVGRVRGRCKSAEPHAPTLAVVKSLHLVLPVAAKELGLLVWRDLQTNLVADECGCLGLDDRIVESASLVAGEGWQKVEIVHRLEELVADPRQISCRVFETNRLIVQDVVGISNVIFVRSTFVSVLEECWGCRLFIVFIFFIVFVVVVGIVNLAEVRLLVLRVRSTSSAVDELGSLLAISANFIGRVHEVLAIAGSLSIIIFVIDYNNLTRTARGDDDAVFLAVVTGAG
jgi:hypothetical protein